MGGMFESILLDFGMGVSSGTWIGIFVVLDEVFLG